MGRTRLYDIPMLPYPIRFPPEMLERLRAASKEQGRPISTIVRRAIEEALRNPDKK